MEKFRAAGYEPSAPGWPGDSDTVEETRKPAGPRRRLRDRRDRRPLRRAHRRARGKADRDRPLLRRPDRPAAARPGSRRGRGRDRPGADQGRAEPAALGPPGRLDRPAQSREQEARRLAHTRSVPVRLRQPALGRGLRGALREMDDPLAGPAALRGRARELHTVPRPRRSRPTTRPAARSSSPPAARITPSRPRSATRRSSSTASRRRSPI